jgi:hypothetical protein
MNIWEKTKRNHGLEHGTIALIMNRFTRQHPIAGYSIASGFFVVGGVTTEQVETCSAEALSRMQAGEADLAVSSFCGTNIVVTAALTMIATLTGYHTAGGGLRGLNRAFSNTALATVASQPLGRMMQRRYTISADVGEMRIMSVTHYNLGKVPVHWVATTCS